MSSLIRQQKHFSPFLFFFFFFFLYFFLRSFFLDALFSTFAFSSSPLASKSHYSFHVEKFIAKCPLLFPSIGCEIIVPRYRRRGRREKNFYQSFHGLRSFCYFPSSRFISTNSEALKQKVQ